MEKCYFALALVLVVSSCGTQQETVVAPATAVAGPQTSVIVPSASAPKPERQMAQQSDKDDKQLMTSESANGLRIEDLSLGSGRQVSGDDERMTIHYVGTFTDGRVFDSSREIGRPFVFRAKQVIPGLAQGMKGMRIGGTRRLTIPPALGYGDRQAGKIPPGSTLIFEVELLGIE